jgi:hypothetical protein
MPARRLNVIAWLLAVALWDGLLPVGIVLLPALVQLVVPNRREPIEVIAVAVPIAGFFVRIWSGTKRIRANHCSPGFQTLQLYVFGLGVLQLFVFDAVVILSHIMPAAAFGPGDYLIFAALWGVYYLLMLFAMYPGREPVPHDEY